MLSEWVFPFPGLINSLHDGHSIQCMHACMHVVLQSVFVVVCWCRGHSDAVLCLQFDRYQVVSGSKDKTIKVRGRHDELMDRQSDRCSTCVWAVRLPILWL